MTSVIRAACGLIYGAYAISMERGFIFPSVINRVARSKMTDQIYDYTQVHAKKMGIQKEVVLIENFEHPISYAGINWFSGHVALRVRDNEVFIDQTKIEIISGLARIKANLGLTITVLPMILGMTTHILLESKSPIKAAFAGLAAAGTSALAVIAWSGITHGDYADRVVREEAGS